MKELRDLKDWTIHNAQSISEQTHVTEPNTQHRMLNPRSGEPWVRKAVAVLAAVVVLLSYMCHIRLMADGSNTLLTESLYKVVLRKSISELILY